jgi:hypothetical protein
MFDWLNNLFTPTNTVPQQGTTNWLCENLDPDAEVKCNRHDEHPGRSCWFKDDESFVQWQTEDSANYQIG